MLLQPFLGALIVYHRLTWTVLPALGAVVLVFMVREPLIVLARQRWVWRGERPETAHAKRFLSIELPLLALAGAWLLRAWPWWILIVLGGSASLLSALAVFMTVRNRQRAIWFQTLSAAGLASSALAACLAIEASIPAWGWWFWGLHAAHFLAAILVVHARLESRIAARKAGGALSAEFLTTRRQAMWLQGALSAAAIALVIAGKPFYGAALMLSAVVHMLSLRVMHTPGALSLAMKTVGLRALAVSIAVTLLIVAGSIEAHSS
jgi:hypothetical protein